MIHRNRDSKDPDLSILHRQQSHLDDAPNQPRMMTQEIRSLKLLSEKELRLDGSRSDLTNDQPNPLIGHHRSSLQVEKPMRE